MSGEVDGGDGGAGGELHIQLMSSTSRDHNPEEPASVSSPLLGLDVEVEAQVEKRISSFFSTISRPDPKRRIKPPKELTLTEPENEIEVAPLEHFALWTWGGSRYSGFLCMASASTIYTIMEVIANIFSVRRIPLFENIFIRSTTVLILSFIWLRRTGQPMFGPVHIRGLLLMRALAGCLSLVCFIYSVKYLPLSSAVVLNLTTPIMASIVARMSFKEKLTFPDVGGIICSFLGLLFICQPMLAVEAGETDPTDKVEGIRYVLVGILSSVMGGISYCLIKSGARETDQPVVTVLAFGVLASPLSAICGLSFEKIIMPDVYTIFLVVIFGTLAFTGEVFLARGLQLEKTSKVTNILYLKKYGAWFSMVSHHHPAKYLVASLFWHRFVVHYTWDLKRKSNPPDSPRK